MFDLSQRLTERMETKMHSDMIWHMAIERQAGYRADARKSSLSRAVRRRHELPVVPGGGARRTIAEHGGDQGQPG